MKLSDLIWPTLLASRGLRRRLAWQLKFNYPDELDNRVPIGEGLSIPLFDTELSASFDEIFLSGEYKPMLETMPLPRRWIDLGCYAGYFSLWLEWQLHRAGFMNQSNALLVDANAAIAPKVERLIKLNNLESSWKFCRSAVAKGDGMCEYIQRPYMASSLHSVDDSPGEKVAVPIFTDDNFTGAFAGSYDLLKVDIEGAEFDLLQYYPTLASRARWLCLEWHSWAGSESQIHELAKALGFTLIRELQPARGLPSGCQTSVLLFRNQNLSSDA